MRKSVADRLATYSARRFDRGRSETDRLEALKEILDLTEQARCRALRRRDLADAQRTIQDTVEFLELRYGPKIASAYGEEAARTLSSAFRRAAERPARSRAPAEAPGVPA